MQDILTRYEAAFGQAIILPKVKISYSSNVLEAIKIVITTIMGVRVVLGIGKYLCLPSMVGRDHTVMFSYIKDYV